MRAAKVQKHDHVMYPFPVIYREEVKLTDAESVREIIESHDLFSRDEVELAVELVHERLSRGSKAATSSCLQNEPAEC